MESKLSKAQQEAKMYVDKHKLEQLIGEMLNSLVHAKDPFPMIYMIKYLAGLCKEDELAQNGIIVKGEAPKPKPLVKFPVFPDACNSLLKKHLTRELWDRLKDKRTKHGNDFFSAVRPGIEHTEHDIGLVALDDDSYAQFEPLFFSVAEDLHAWNRGKKQRSDLNVEVPTLDSGAVPLLQVRLLRNFEGVPFPTSLSKKQRTDLETQTATLLADLGGQFTGIEAVKEPVKSRLAAQLVPLEKPDRFYESTAATKDWPEGRGVLVVDSGAVVKVNDLDHLEVFGVSEDGDLKAAFEQAIAVVQHCEQRKPFAKHGTWGYLTSSLKDVGSALQLKALLILSNCENSAVLKWGSDAGLEVVAKEDARFEVTLSCSLGKTEAECMELFVSSIGQVLEMNGGTPESESNSLLSTMVSAEVRKSLANRRILAVSFKDLLVKESDAEVGLVAKHGQCYTGFMEAFEPLINQLHGFGLVESGFEAEFEDVQYNSLFVRSSRLRFSRNIAGDVFVPGLNPAQRTAILSKVQSALSALPGEFIDLESASDDQVKTLNQYRTVVPSPLAGDYAYTQVQWPQGRGVWVSEDKLQFVLVNFRDHIEVVGQDHGCCFKTLYARCQETLAVLQTLGFEWNSYFGYLTSSLKDIGSAMRASVHIKVPLAAQKEEFESWCSENHIACKAVSDQRAGNRLFELSSTRKLKPREGEVLSAFVKSIQGLVEWEQKEQIADFPNFAGTSKALVKTALTKDLWSRYKTLKTPDWIGFYQLIQILLENPDKPFGIGMMMGSAACYTTYQELVDQLILQFFEYPADAKHSKNLNPAEFAGEPLDPSGKYVKGCKVIVRRNIAGFPLAGGVSRQQRLEVANQLRSALEGIGLVAHDLDSMKIEEYEEWIGKGLLFPPPNVAQESCHMARDWPEARSIYVDSQESLYAWVNEEEHLQLFAKHMDLKQAFTALANAVKQIEEAAQFAFDDHYGYFSSNFSYIGTGMTVSVTLALEKASKQANFEAFCKERKLAVSKKESGGKTVVEVSNARRLGVTEVQSVEEVHRGVGELIAWEKQLA